MLQIALDIGAPASPALNVPLLEVVDWINGARTPLRIVPPQSKRLFCGDVGVGAMAELHDIVAAVYGWACSVGWVESSRPTVFVARLRFGLVKLVGRDDSTHPYDS